MTAPKLNIDLGINRWTLREQMAFRDAVGVNPQYAFAQIVKAFEGAEGGVVPDSALNIPPAYLVGLAWVTMKRKRDELTMDDVIDYAGSSDALFEAFSAAMDDLGDEQEEAARPTKAARKKSDQGTD